MKNICDVRLILLALLLTVAARPLHAAYTYSYMGSGSGYVWGESFIELDWWEEYQGTWAYVDAAITGPSGYQLDSGADFEQGSASVSLEVAATDTGYYELQGDDYVFYLDYNAWMYIGSAYGGAYVSPPSAGPPSISAITPQSGVSSQGGYFTLYGENLDPDGCGCASVSFGSITYEADSQINVYYGAGMEQGSYEVYVTTSGGTSNSVTFTIARDDPTPGISSVSPSSWPAGTTTSITIQGSGFGTSPSLNISASGLSYSVTSAADTVIYASVTVPSNAPYEPASLTVTSNGYGGNGFVGPNPPTSAPYDVQIAGSDPQPVISSVSPSGPWQAGTSFSVTVSGTGFGTSPSLSISGTGLSLTNYGGSDTVVSGYVSIDPSAPNEMATIAVTSNGYYGSPFQSTTGQSNQGQAQVQVQGRQPPQLSCPASVTRGGQVTCTVSNVAPGNVTSWTFAGGGETVNGPSGTTSWTGIMVQSGNISVTVSGQQLTASVTVQSRGWNTQPAQPVEVANGTLTVTLTVPPVPDASGRLLLGWSEASFQWSRPGRSTISTGPNAGFGYYASPLGLNSSTFWYKYIIDPDLEDQNSQFSQHQCGTGGWISWSNLLAGTRRHEYNSATQSHWAFYANALNASATNFDVYLEGRVAPPSQNTQAYDSETDGQLAVRANQVIAATQQEPYPINYSETGSFLGNVNIGPNYANCN